ncbi:hypothetical protein ACSQ67_008728 [Phaseolus vulgaris]
MQSRSSCQIKDRCHSKYQPHTLRTHLGVDDNNYWCVFKEEDEENKVCVSLSKELMNVALKLHITFLGPLVLSLSEKIKFLSNLIKRKVLKTKVESYMRSSTSASTREGGPCWTACKRVWSLKTWHLEPSRMTF